MLNRLKTGFIAGVAACVLAACASTGSDQAASATAEAALNALAEDYVKLTLEIGEHEDGFVDAYYGPEAWAEAASANPRSVPDLLEGAAELTERLSAVDLRDVDPVLIQRRRFLVANIAAAQTRLRMTQGQRLSFADEAEALFGVRPELRPLTSYDPVLAEIDAMIPGDEPLTARVAAFRARFVVPRDRLEPVITAAIAECRRRTALHMALPDPESFTLEYVEDKPWSAYNWYKGGAVSLIQVNAGLPISIDRAVDWGCHEGYPGHHVYNALLEQTFVNERGWMEMSVYPLFSPASFIAEGTANYGIDLAFPGDEKTQFEREVLYPLAGLDPASADELDRFLELTRRLSGAEYIVADDYLAGRIDRATAADRLEHYLVMTRDRAEQRTRFMDTYRSYIINYGLGPDVAQAWVERQGGDPWDAMQTLLSSQTLPVDILP
jgi:hypothetical protein